MNFTHIAGNLLDALVKLTSNDKALLVTQVDAAGNDVSNSSINRATINCYIGKPTNGHFVTTRSAATAVTFSGLPGGLSAITDKDIESVRQIDNAGTVVAVYNRRTTVMTVSANVLTVTGATFAATDSLVVYTNIPVAVVAGAGGAGGGSVVYTNVNNKDFTATVTNGAATITVTGLKFTLEDINVALGSIVKIAVTTGLKTTLSPTSIQVSGGVITLGGIDNFVTGDKVAMTIIGPDKSYDTEQDITKVVVQNSDETSVETLVNETNILGYKASGDGGGDENDLVDADGAFSVANIAENYTAWQTADNQSARILETQTDGVPGVDSGTNISTTSLTGAATWASKAYSLPQVKRYEINMEGWKYATIQYILRCLTFCNAYFKIYGTLDATATVDSDTGWENLSAELLGDANGVAVATSTTAITSGIVTIDRPTPMLKYMVKIVVESNSASPNTNSFIVYAKKSK